MNGDKPTTDAELAAGLRAFVNNVVARFESPHGVPLTPDEQATFIRSVYYQAKNLRESKPFAGAELGAALEAYTKETARQAEARTMVANAEAAFKDHPIKRAVRKGKS